MEQKIVMGNAYFDMFDTLEVGAKMGDFAAGNYVTHISLKSSF